MQVPSLGGEDPPGEGHSNPLQYSCLENPMDIGAWWATVHGATKSQTGLSDQAVTCSSNRSRVSCRPSWAQAPAAPLGVFLRLLALFPSRHLHPQVGFPAQ